MLRKMRIQLLLSKKLVVVQRVTSPLDSQDRKRGVMERTGWGSFSFNKLQKCR